MEGQRVAKGGSKLPWIITGSVVGMLAAAYLGVCAWAAGRDAILPNVSVSGIDVSNMTVEQAQSAIASTVEQKGGDLSFILRYEDIEERLTLDQLAVDAGQSAQNAWNIGRGNFFTGGPQLVSHMLGVSSQVPVVLPEDDPAVTDLIHRVKERIDAAAEDHGYQMEGGRLVMTKGAPVITVDWETLKADLFDHRFPDAVQSMAEGVEEYQFTFHADQSEAEEPDFEAIHREVYAEARDASLDVNTMEVTDDAVGVDFDVQALKAAYQGAQSGETFSVPLTITQPRVTREELEAKLFKDLLGEATSTVSGSAARKSNVKLAASACSEKIILPGEVFSYNEATGPRTAAKGYQSAPAYYNGATVQEIGGGVCQPSSTLYYAVLHTTLEIVERTNHRYAVGYVPDGMDATVSYGSLDFKFRNNTDYPIKIVTSSYDAGGARKLNVKIYGTNPEGHYARPTANVFNVVAPTVQYVPDPGVARGSLVLDHQQNAYRGRTAQTFRTVYAADGTQLERQDLGLSVYKMRPTVYHYNPADGDPSTWSNGQPPADPGTADPGTADPGTTNPGTADPGATDPGTADPGTANPGTADPGTVQPENSGTPEPSPEPQQPSDSGLNPIDPGGQGT